MDDKVAYWASVALGALALLLMVTNVALVNSDRSLQAEVAQRQGAITNGNNLGQLNQALIQALAQAAVKDNDKEARDLLAAQGITIKQNAAPEAKAETKAKESKPE